MVKFLDSKKGFAFSLISVLLVLVFGAIVTTFMVNLDLDSNLVFESKIESLNSYYGLVKDNYLEIALAVSSRAALNTMVNFTEETGLLFPSDSGVVVEDNAFCNGNYTEMYYYSNYCDDDACKGSCNASKLLIPEFVKLDYANITSFDNYLLDPSGFSNNITAPGDRGVVNLTYASPHIRAFGPYVEFSHVSNLIFNCNGKSMGRVFAPKEVVFEITNSENLTFTNCSYNATKPFMINNSKNIKIINSNFYNYGSSAIDISNSEDIVIKHNWFEENETESLQLNRFSEFHPEPAGGIDSIKESTFFDSIYRNLLLRGDFNVSLGGVSYNCTNCNTLMANKTLSALVTRLVNSSKAVVFHSDEYTIVPDYNGVTWTQTGPWDVDVMARFKIRYISREFNLSDQDNYAFTSVSILNLEDPLYASFNVSRPVLALDEALLNNTFDFDVLNYTIQNKLYLQSDRGLSFLDRLRGIEPLEDSLKDSRIESFIFPGDYYFHLDPAVSFGFNSTYKSKSSVDHYFFRDSFNGCGSSFDPNEFLYLLTNYTGLTNTDGFRLDLNSTILYLGSDFEPAFYDVGCSGSGTI